MSPDEINLGYRLLAFLRIQARDRAVHKFNVIGKSGKGEFELSLGRDLSQSEKQDLIWIWDELKRKRLISATGTDLVNPEAWVIVSFKGLTISESDFAELFADEASGTKRAERLIDAVTGIFQRGELDIDLERAGTDQKRTLPLSFLMIDLDHFKIFNDTYGHVIGDEVLSKVAQTIAKVVQGKGQTYRYGGEEISVVLPNHTLTEAVAVAERIRHEIETACVDSLPDSRVTASLGVATIPDTSETVKNLVTDADRALYEAKNSGRNRAACAARDNTGQPIGRKRPIKLEEDLNVRIVLELANRLSYLLTVENQTSVEILVNRISIEHDNIALMEPAFPKDGDRWDVPSRHRRHIGWSPHGNPGDSLVRLFPNEGIQFSSWIDVVLSVSVGADRHEYRQKLAVAVFAMNGDLKQIAG